MKKKFYSPAAWARLDSLKALGRLVKVSPDLNLFTSGYSSLMGYSAERFSWALPELRSFLLGTTLNMPSLAVVSSENGLTEISLLGALFVLNLDNLSEFSN